MSARKVTVRFAPMQVDGILATGFTVLGGPPVKYEYDEKGSTVEMTRGQVRELYEFLRAALASEYAAEFEEESTRNAMARLARAYKESA